MSKFDASFSRIYCTGCHAFVDARLTSGAEMYPHKEDLKDIPFWVCDTCRAFVGTHYKTKRKTRPLGYLATPEVKRWRMAIHQIADPLWKRGLIQRGNLYQRISKELGRDFHAAKIYDAEEGQKVYQIVRGIKQQLDPRNSPWNN